MRGFGAACTSGPGKAVASCRARTSGRLRWLVRVAIAVATLTVASPALADPQLDSVSAPAGNTIVITGQELDQVEWFSVSLGSRVSPGASLYLNRTEPNLGNQPGDVTMNEWSASTISFTVRPGFTLDRYDARYIYSVNAAPRGSVAPDSPVYVPGPEEDLPVAPATDDGPQFTGVSAPAAGRPGNTIVIEGTNLDQVPYNGTVTALLQSAGVGWNRAGNPNISPTELQITEYSRTRIAVRLSDALLLNRYVTRVENPSMSALDIPLPYVYIPRVGEALDTTPPVVTISAPVDGSVYTQGQDAPVLVSITDEYALQGADARIVETGEKVRLRRNATGTVPTVQLGTFTLEITAVDAFTNITVATARYTVTGSVDADGDGVTDSIQTGPGAFSDGATTGVIQDTAGLSVLVSDVPSPDGVRITVSGSGTARATFSVCGGFTVSLRAGSHATITCGSVTVNVEIGSAQIALAGGTTVEVPAGVTATVSDTGGGGFSVVNLGGGAVTVTKDGVVQTIAAGQSGLVDTSPPLITANVVGTPGTNGWYRSNVSITWTVLDGQSVPTLSGCGPGSVNTDTAGRTFTCAATSGGGTTTQSVTVKRDTTAPTATYATHPATYTVDQAIAFACNSSDAMSGIATPCQAVSASASAFPLGLVTRTSVATDLAGNSRTATTTFTVRVTGASLCNLTRQFWQGSAKYAAATPLQRTAVNAIGAVGCVALNSLTTSTAARQKAALIATYRATVALLLAPGWLTGAQASTLGTFANGL
jgi:hypothetical protein